MTLTSNKAHSHRSKLHHPIVRHFSRHRVRYAIAAGTIGFILAEFLHMEFGKLLVELFAIPAVDAFLGHSIELE